MQINFAIHVDSRAALSAVVNNNPPPRCRIKGETHLPLHNNQDHWLKDHSGERGNQRADHLAKTTTTYQYSNIEYNIVTPREA